MSGGGQFPAAVLLKLARSQEIYNERTEEPTVADNMMPALLIVDMNKYSEV